MAESISVLNSLLKDVNRLIFDCARDILRQHGLSAPAMGILGQVLKSPGTTVSEMARGSGIAKSHVSNTVEGLVEMGYLEKRPDPDDQRLVRIYATPKAQEHFQTMHGAIHGRLAQAMSALSTEQVAAIIEGLEILQSALQQTKSEIDRS